MLRVCDLKPIWQHWVNYPGPITYFFFSCSFFPSPCLYFAKFAERDADNATTALLPAQKIQGCLRVFDGLFPYLAKSKSL